MKRMPMDKKLVKEANNDEIASKISQSKSVNKIFVEISTIDGKMLIQKSFLNTASGMWDAEKLQNSIKTKTDLKKYFGL